LPLPIENLDEWSYRELVQEGISMLPSIAPEWTNYNASDPGITLLELFAYFTEMLIFQTGHLTEGDMKAFVKLLDGPDVERSGERGADQILRESILNLRQPSRAVTCMDFESFAHLADSGVVRAKCLPRLNLAERNEAARSAARPGHVSIVVVPDPDLNEAGQRSMIANVMTYIEPRRILTTRVHVVPARYVAFGVRLKVAAFPGVAADAAADQAREALLRFLHPIAGGHDGRGWIFGRDIFVSDLYQVVDQLPTTDYVSRQVDPHTGRELEELVPGHAGLERIRRNSDGELVALRIAPDELPGSIEFSVTGEISAIDRSRQV
jgi:hypothetical protein